MRIRNKGLEPIKCHRNTNRESAHGDLGDYLVGRGVDHSNLIGVSRGAKKGLGQSRGGEGEHNQQQRQAICLHNQENGLGAALGHPPRIVKNAVKSLSRTPNVNINGELKSLGHGQNSGMSNPV